MFNYYVRLFSRSALIIGDTAQKFPFADSEIMVYDRWRGKDIHEGLVFSVRLAADDLYSALKKSLPTVLPLASMLAIAHSTAIDKPHVIFGIDVDSAKTDRQFGQVIYNLSSAWLHRRTFDRDTFAPIWGAFARSTDLTLQGAVISAMYHLRRSFNSATLIEEFIELYSGLESLNSLLQQKYGLHTTETRSCKCGAPIRTLVATGIRHAIIGIAGRSIDDWKNIRRARVDIVHRHGSLPNATTGLYDDVLVARQALQGAIRDLLGLPAAADSTHIPVQEPSAVLVLATLKAVSAQEILETGPIPHFELRYSQELVTAKPGPALSEPIAAQLDLALREFDGECDPHLEARVWTGNYYDLPAGAPEVRRTEFIAKLFRESKRSDTTPIDLGLSEPTTGAGE
jgi:hypothetical protein